MLKWTALLASAAAAHGAAAPPPAPPACDALPACATCAAHTMTGCTWCSEAAVDSSGASTGANCYNSRDGESCPSGAIDFSDGECYAGYTCGASGACELAADGYGQSLEDCEAECAAPAPTYRCNSETGTCDECPAYTSDAACVASQDDCAASCAPASTYSCNATTLTCEEDPFSSYSADDCAGWCGHMAIPEFVGDWISTDIQSDYGDTKWTFQYTEDGDAYINDGTELAHAQVLRNGPTSFNIFFLNSSTEGQSMMGYYVNAPDGPVTESIVQTACAPFWTQPVSLEDAMYGAGVGVQWLSRLKSSAPGAGRRLRGPYGGPYGGPPHGGPGPFGPHPHPHPHPPQGGPAGPGGPHGMPPSPWWPDGDDDDYDGGLSPEDDVLTGTWRGYSLTDEAEAGVFVFTFDDPTSLTFFDPTANKNQTATVTTGEPGDDGVFSVSLALESGDSMDGVGQLAAGTPNTNTRLFYLALGDAGAPAATDFESALDGQNEWVLTACLLSDPGYCTFERSAV